MGESNRLFDGDAFLLVAVVVLGIVGSGIARNALGRTGHEALGTAVFVMGYLGMVLVVWYGWIRPLDVAGPSAP